MSNRDGQKVHAVADVLVGGAGAENRDEHIFGIRLRATQLHTVGAV